MFQDDFLFYSSINFQKAFEIGEQKANDFALENYEKKLKLDSSLVTRATNFDSETPFYFSNIEEIKELVDTLQLSYNSVIFALFHFGEHIHIPIDLALAGIKISIPVTGNPFHSIYDKKHSYSSLLEKNLELLSIEEEGSVFSTIKAIRNCQNMCIYIDGNIGKDGTNVKSGYSEIDFLNFKIKAKNSIEKLSKKYHLPIIPVFANTVSNNDKKLHIGKYISPTENNILRKLYGQLQTQLQQNPTDWFYIQCLHRWIIPSQKPFTLPKDLTNETLEFNNQVTRLYKKSGSYFLVNYQTMRAIKVDSELSNTLINKELNTIRSSFVEQLKILNNESSASLIHSLCEENIISLKQQAYKIL